jgi:lipoprotein-anchoring transpeptidase ErfK/SrfK
MPKKTLKPARKSKNYALKLTILVFGAFVFAVGLTIFLNLKSQHICANSISCIQDLSGKKEDTTEGVFLGQKIVAPTEQPNTPELAISNMKSVLGASTGDPKHIYVDLTHQKLYAYEGANLKFSFLISSGKWHATPTGDFRTWVWLRYTRMSGGDASKGTYYNLPNVPYTMFFSNNEVPKNDGYSLHGAYWHNNFGHVMSHGCVNMKPSEAAQIFYWTNPSVINVAYPTATNPGTLITIYGTAPPEETSFID